MRYYILLVVGLIGCDSSKFNNACSDPPSPKIEVAFSPHGGCTERVVKLLNRAERTIHIQAYSFTSRPIGDAILRAHNRNVKVQIILDRSDEKSKSLLSEMRDGHVPTFIDARHPIAHNKLIIVDSHLVETGSFNFTKQAESNAENCLIIDDEEIAKQYMANWNTHKEHSE